MTALSKLSSTELNRLEDNLNSYAFTGITAPSNSKRQSMAWGRGLLRIWIVFSALWIVAHALLNYENLSSLVGTSGLRTDISIDELEITKLQHGMYSFAAQNSGPLELETGGIDESMVEAWQLMLGAIVENLNAQNAAVNRAAQRRARNELKDTLQIGLLSPLSVLAIGWSFLWALRGFRKDSECMEQCYHIDPPSGIKGHS